LVSMETPDSPMYATVDVGGPDVYPGRCVYGCMEGNECGANSTCDYENGAYGDCETTESRKFCNNQAKGLAEILPCDDNEYCDVSLGSTGYCNPCPNVPEQCFYEGLNGLGAKDCAARCYDDKTDTKVEKSNCKVCPRLNFTLDDITDDFSSTKKEIENPCSFCALKNSSLSSTCTSVNQWDMEFPDRTINMFGSGIECWAIAEFYKSLNIEADSSQCRSGRQFNYVCGCSDSVGYAGADSTAKKIALVWMPRIGSLLSILGSSILIYSVLSDRQKRKKVTGELLVTLSAFDIIGSLGYVFTTLPTPATDYIEGGKGNSASCTAQGFFIQLGTISMFLNVSIAFYYVLIIQFSWREHRLRKSRIYYLLYIVPVIVGSILAFAGIPFYSNAILWCNNSQPYWPETFVGIAIVTATALMLSVCFFVYKSEKASSRYSVNNRENISLTRKVFGQSLAFLAAFYLTWPAYLALQIMLAKGKAFSNYGFYLFAGTAVTLQGFWNFVFQPGVLKKAAKKSKEFVSKTSKVTTVSRSFRRTFVSSAAQPDNANDDP